MPGTPPFAPLADAGGRSYLRQERSHYRVVLLRGFVVDVVRRTFDGVVFGAGDQTVEAFAVGDRGSRAPTTMHIGEVMFATRSTIVTNGPAESNRTLKRTCCIGAQQRSWPGEPSCPLHERRGGFTLRSSDSRVGRFAL